MDNHHDPPIPIKSLAELCSKEDFANHPENPLKKSEIEWIFKTRATNGFAEAFVKVNERKFLVHVPCFLNVLAARRGS
jgi:hypothetical protein